MPDAEEILDGLAYLTNHFSWLSILWHILIYFLVSALFLNWKPKNRWLGSMLAILLLSVSLMAWITGNPFNGLLFAIAGILMIVTASRIPDSSVSTAHSWTTVLGVIVILFGLIYPHFLETDNYFKYLYMAPTGLIPCPTLSTVIGFTILYNGLQSRTWPWVLIVPGFIYSIIGVFILGVYLDMVLMLASAILVIVVLQVPREQQKGLAMAKDI